MPKFSNFSDMYLTDEQYFGHSKTANEIYNKIRDFCYRNNIRVDVRPTPSRSIDVGYGYGIHNKYDYVTNYPELELTMRFEMMARIVEALEEADMYYRMKEKERAMLESNPELAEMYEKYLTFKALCEKIKD